MMDVGSYLIPPADIYTWGGDMAQPIGGGLDQRIGGSLDQPIGGSIEEPIIISDSELAVDTSAAATDHHPDVIAGT